MPPLRRPLLKKFSSIRSFAEVPMRAVVVDGGSVALGFLPIDLRTPVRKMPSSEINKIKNKCQNLHPGPIFQSRY